jgi:hypothetical protein
MPSLLAIVKCYFKYNFSSSHNCGDLVFVLFVSFELHEQYFSYLATVTTTGDRAANLELSLKHLRFLAARVHYVPHLLRHVTSVFKFISERPVILTSECLAFGEGF